MSYISRIACIVFSFYVAAGGASAQTLTTLYSFTGGADGQGLSAQKLALDSAGNIYGVSCGGSNGNGSVFKLDPNVTPANLTVLYSFKGAADGAIPYCDYNGGVIYSGGTLYGSTVSGGDLPCGDIPGQGCGVLFKVPARQLGKETVLHTFTGSPNDGDYPTRILLQKGSLYGTTRGGGANGDGAVFKLNSSAGKWTESLLYSFSDNPDGSHPTGFVRDAATGNLYGITADGGGAGSSGCVGNNWGTIFKLDASGHESVLYRFSGGADGGYCDDGNPSLIRDGSGNLYGTTFWGGDPSCFRGIFWGCGYVFKFDPTTTKLTHLHDFTPAEAYGDSTDQVVRDSKGNLYGPLYALPNGAVFKLNKSHVLTQLYDFTNGSDGGGPGSVVRDSKGNLYGVTVSGGQYGYGTIFRITPQ